MKKPRIAIFWRKGDAIFVPFGGAAPLIQRAVSMGMLEPFPNTKCFGFAGWKLKKPFAILLFLICSACNSTWVVQGVPVHAPTRKVPRREAYVIGAAALAGFVVGDQLVNPKQKEKIREALNVN